MSKIDRRILKSQETIKKSIIELMSEKNFDAITIQDISVRANVHRATIYLHCTDKFDLLDKLILFPRLILKVNIVFVQRIKAKNIYQS